MGSEFMPPLNEGDLLFMPIADPSVSLDENTEIAAAPERRDPGVPRGGIRRGESRPRRHVDGSVAAQHDGDHRPPEAARRSGGRA